MLIKHCRIFAEVRLWTIQIPLRNPTFSIKFWHLIHTKNVTELTIHSSGYDWYKTILTVFYLDPKQLPAKGYVVFIRIFGDSFRKNCRTICSTDVHTVHNFTYLINYTRTFCNFFSRRIYIEENMKTEHNQATHNSLLACYALALMRLTSV